MNHTFSVRLALALVGAVCMSGLQVRASDALPQGARLAVIGDSITEQKLYTKFIEVYLLACAGREDVRVFQFGWGGETAGGFTARLENDLAPFQPTVATLCYGMNDGQYRPYTEDIGRSYESNMRKVVAGLVKSGVARVVLGSPGAVDTRYFVRQNFAPLSGADGYNKNLGALRDIDRRLADELGQGFADVHQAMLDAMAKAKAALGEDYDVCGRDGFHPGPNGHLVMAYAFLRALGCDGAIGDITLDLNGAPTVSAGHKIVSGSGGTAKIVSTRYPFCFEGEARSSGGTRSIAPFFPFNDQLNRLVLKVKNLRSSRATVTWAGETQEFTSAQLEAGMNLTASFWKTPFESDFRNVLNAVAAKQNFETTLIKSLVTSFRHFGTEARNDPELGRALSMAAKRLMVRQAELDRTVRRAIVPVEHTIIVTPLP